MTAHGIRSVRKYTEAETLLPDEYPNRASAIGELSPVKRRNLMPGQHLIHLVFVLQGREDLQAHQA